MIRSNGFNGSMITSFERKAFCYSTSDQPSMYQQLAFSGMKANDGTDDRSSVERPSCIYGSARSSPMVGENNFIMEVPTVESIFSLPQSLFERVLASKQNVPSKGNHLSTSTTGSAVQQTIPARTQRLRHFDEYVTDLSRNEAKRPRLLHSENSLDHKMYLERKQREQYESENIRQTLNDTRDKFSKPVELKARGHLPSHLENYVGGSFGILQGQSSRALLKLRRHKAGKSRVYDQTALPQRALHVPGVCIVPSDAKEGCNWYTTISSAGLALNHKTLPKLVAVHSVMKNSTTLTNATRPLVDAEDLSNKERGITSAAPSVSELCKESRCENSNANAEVRQITANYPLLNNIPLEDLLPQNRDDSVVLTKHISRKRRLSERTSSGEEITQKCDSPLNDNVQTMNSCKHDDDSGQKGNLRGIDHQRFVGHLRSDDHANNSAFAEKVNCSELIDQPGPIFSPEQEKYPGPMEQDGSQTPCISVAGKSKATKRDEDANQQDDERLPNSIKLTKSKTVSEISQKIVETRERVKNETIEWKKTFLFKLERHLVKKLRRAENLSGEKTEIEDLQQDDSEHAPKGKKRKGEGIGRRLSRQESVSGDGIYDSHGRKKGESQNSVTESVMDGNDDSEGGAGSHDTRRSTTKQESVTENLTSNVDNATSSNKEKKGKSSSKGIDASVTDMDNVDKHGFFLPEQVQEMESRVEQTEHLQNETVGKCAASQDVEISSEQTENALNLKVIENKGQASDGFTNDFHVHKKAEMLLETNKNTHIEDCVTRDDSCEVITAEPKNTLDRYGPKLAELGDIEKERHELDERVTKSMSQNRDRQNLGVSPGIINAREEFQANQLREGNVFDIISSQVKAPLSLKKDINSLPVASVQPLTVTTLNGSTTAEKKSTTETGHTLVKNLSSLEKKLTSCSKQAIEAKPKSLDCERNVWSTLRKQGIM